MSLRRRVGEACCALAWFAAIAGCKSEALPSSTTGARASSPATTTTSLSPATTREEEHGGFRFLVSFRGGADESSPLVVGMHGRGGSPERFSRVLRDFSGRAEIALAQAPFKLDQGWSWLPGAQRWDDSESAAAFDAVEKKLWAAIIELSHGRRVIVTGFSQGGMLSYVLAARHPREIAYAFPIGGGAPAALFPHDGEPTAPVYAMHGTSDDIVDISFARSTIAAFQAQGAKAELREFPGVGHDMPTAVREDLLAHIQAATAAAVP